MPKIRKIIFSIVLCAVPQIVCTAQNRAGNYESGEMPKPAPLNANDTITICITGDVMLHQAQINNARKSGEFDFSEYFSDIIPFIKDADIAVANMEFTLAGSPYTGYPSFSAPDAYAEYAAGCGFNVFLAANNHIFDKGRAGYMRTLDIYRRMKSEGKILFAGLKEETPLYARAKGVRIAIVNATYGTNVRPGVTEPGILELSDTASLGKALREADADLTVVLPHWGTEYSPRHSRAQEKTARWMAENGADIIVGAHPHVIQDMQILETGGKKVPVIYSLGNAVSNMSAADTQLGLLATIRAVRHCDGSMEILEPEFTYMWCSLPGSLCGSHKVIPVREFIGRRNEWLSPGDYDKMIRSYDRVRETVGIKDSFRKKASGATPHDEQSGENGFQKTFVR